jgi:predicted GIY-YIG superfamily endonuclease
MNVTHLLNGFKPYISGQQGVKDTNLLTGKPGAYCITHVETGKVYIGSTGNLATRVSGNLGALKRNKHKNNNLQKVFNDDSTVEVLVKPTATLTDAVALEQQLVNEFKDTKYLCNIGITDVARPQLGVEGQTRTTKHKEQISEKNRLYAKTPEGRQHILERTEKRSRKVIIDGITYPSQNEAARVLGIAYQSVRKLAAMTSLNLLISK